nr:T9SS type A sorting domain-containing protein [candidate division KSB1 bacterium]
AYKVLGTDMAESDYSKFIPATPVSAASGDANGDLSVNVLDIVAIVNYILEENPQPFLAEAADVNDDGSINVLDIVGVVNIILGAPQLLANAEPMEKVRLLIYNNRLVLENGENVAGLQLSLNHSETSTSEVRASKKLAGFEMGSVQKENRHNLVLYSLSGSRMADLQEIINIKGGQNINVDEVVACNAQGKPLSIEVIDMAHVEIPKKFVLCQNYPNPFNPITRIKYGLPNAAQVKISIYNLLGQYVRTLTEGMKESGYHEIIWDGKNEAGQLVSSGLYFYRIKANAFVETKKLLLVR